MALQEWVLTNSPFTYWYNMVQRHLDIFAHLDGEKATFNPRFFNMDPQIFSIRTDYGLPLEDAKMMCKTFYKENIAEVTLEILQPMVLQVKKDVRATFTERLGVAGA